jgi:SPP1 family phage portal protein
MNGRNKIIVDYLTINDENVMDVYLDAQGQFQTLKGQIQNLYNIYRGQTKIDQKEKETRKDINFKITENIPYQIVNFKIGHIFGEPVQYVARNSNILEVDKFNDLMKRLSKGAEDNALAEWLFICGVAYRYIKPNPFKIKTLSPLNTYLIRSDDVLNSVIGGVVVTTHKGVDLAYLYTPEKIYTINQGINYEVSDNNLGFVPIVEYTTQSRIGAFEPAIPLTDAINSLQSNRMDDIAQIVNSILILYGAEMDAETHDKLEQWKTLMLPDGADAKYISPQLGNQVQDFKNDLYQSVLNICAMPNRNGGSSTSDTGRAVIYRDGWTDAEAYAKIIEARFIESENKFLEFAFSIVRDVENINLTLDDIDVKFARRYTDDLLTKVQAMQQMMAAGIKPDIAISTSGIWNDPTTVAIESRPYLVKWEEENVREDGQEASYLQETSTEIIL